MAVFLDRENGHQAFEGRLDRIGPDGVALVMRRWLAVHGMLPGQRTVIAQNHVQASSDKKYNFSRSPSVLDCRMRTRIDCLNAILIDAIVSNHRTRGIRSAAEALMRNDVSLEMALRVLTRPWQRRAARTEIPLFGHRIPE